VSALGDENETVRGSACQALGKIGEKAATNEVISKLVSALGDENAGVRVDACQALENIGEKAATNEVISKLVSALGDENTDVRSNACQALGKIGEKAATNEVISKLVSALGDKNRTVRWSACRALKNIGEKAATNEVISKLVILLNSDIFDFFHTVADAIGGILSSPVVITQLSPEIVSDLFLSKDGLRCLENASADELIKFFFTAENASWLPVISRFTLLVGTAVTVTGEKVVVYGRKESVELSVPALKLREQLVEAFTDQAKRLHLSLELL
jgi:HEAT repeat protein